MTYAIPRKGRLYRISGVLIAEDAGAFIYPSDPFPNNFNYPNRIRLDKTPYFILDVDCVIDDSDKGYEYIRGIVQGYNGSSYLSSYNYSWLQPF